MARRFSGEVRISVRWDDRMMRYVCGVTYTDFGTRVTLRVNVDPPTSLDTAVDTPAAYDRAAHAAISFSGGDVHSLASWTDSGWHIGRDAARAWPNKEGDES